MTKERKSNLELARIVAIILIVLYHVAIFRRNPQDLRIFDEPFHGNQIFVYVFQMWGLTGVGLFFLISGWFLQDVKITSIKKTVKILLVVYFYHTLDTVISYFLHINDENLFRNIYAVITSPLEFWYIPAYLVVFLFSPLINELFKNMSMKKLGRILEALFCIMPVFTSFFGGGITMSDCSLAFFYYILSIWLKISPNNFFDQYRKGILWISLFSVIIISILSILTFGRLPDRIFNLVAGRFSFLQVIIAVSLFYVFYHIQIPYSKIINRIAACTLGIYLLHESDVMRYLLWNKLIPVGEYFHDQYRYCIMVAAGACISLICCIIVEMLRQKIIENLISFFIKT